MMRRRFIKLGVPAATFDEVIDCYESRFNIGLTPQERSDLIAFLRAL